jgi:thiamine-monophosphate kinase
MDLSDGLALDLHRLCQESGCAAELNGALPVFPGASVQQALSGGEDYELLFAVPANRRVPDSVAGLPITEIGRCVKGKAGRVHFDGKPVPAVGWDPFKPESAPAPRRNSSARSS